MKRLSWILALTLCVSLLAGCAGTPVVYQTNCTCPVEAHTETVDPAVEETAAAPVVEGAVKTGLSVVTAIEIDEAAGKASYDVTFAAVNVDDNGVITACAFDSLGADVALDAIAEANGEVKTKHELGFDYGMVAYNASTMEWFQQADALAEYAVGKTLEELKNGAVGESGYAQDADLAASATIYLGGYVSAIEEAVANAKHLGASAGDELKLAAVSKLAEGTLNCDVAVLTLADGVITSCFLDSLQASLNVAEDGTVSAGNVLTKNELGYDYGMVAYNASTMEWFEQAEGFAAYITGKTPAEVNGIAVDESTYPTDADLTASCTIAIGGFQALIAKAAQ